MTRRFSVLVPVWTHVLDQKGPVFVLELLRCGLLRGQVRALVT